MGHVALMIMAHGVGPLFDSEVQVVLTTGLGVRGLGVHSQLFQS